MELKEKHVLLFEAPTQPMEREPRKKREKKTAPNGWDESQFCENADTATTYHLIRSGFMYEMLYTFGATDYYFSFLSFRTKNTWSASAVEK